MQTTRYQQTRYPKSPSARGQQPDTLEVVQELGAGAQGKCHLMRSLSDNKKYVRKVSHWFKMSGQKPLEVVILREILVQHQRTIKLISYAFHGSTLTTFYDFYPGGDLGSCRPQPGQRQSQSFLWHVFLQLADVLAYLHHGYVYDEPGVHRPGWRPVIHCDIKPENIFLKTLRTRENPYPSLVLGDFGLASLTPGELNGGDPLYLAPEIESTGNTMETDVYALGVTIHDLVHGFPPWGGEAQPRPTWHSTRLNGHMKRCLMSSRRRISSLSLVEEIRMDYERMS